MITVTIKDNCTTAIISSKHHTAELNHLDNSFPVDCEAIYSFLFESREEFGIPDSWKDPEMDENEEEYYLTLQYNDFVTWIRDKIEWEGDF